MFNHHLLIKLSNIQKTVSINMFQVVLTLLSQPELLYDIAHQNQTLFLTFKSIGASGRLRQPCDNNNRFFCYQNKRNPVTGVTMGVASGGDKPPDQAQLYSEATNGSTSTTSAQAGGEGDATEVRMRSFVEILASEQEERNILEIHLTRMSSMVNNVMTQAKALNHDDIAELIFDLLNVDYKQCVGFYYNKPRCYSVQLENFSLL